MLVCKSVSVWGHDLSPNRNSTGALDGRAVRVFGLIQTMERECLAYEYQEASV